MISAIGHRRTVSLRERTARWLLLLTLLHTIPVVWITPVAAGTAPTIGLLAFGVASLFTLDREGIALGLMVLVPVFAYLGIGYLIAWALGKLLERTSKWMRIAVLAALVGVPLGAVYFPVYVAGGHNSASSATLFQLLKGTLSPALVWSYWLTFHITLAGLFAAQFLRADHALVRFAERWRKPALGTIAVGGAALALYFGYPTLVCRPLAELGNNAAQVCVAKASSSRDQAYRYERAALDGHTEAIAWMVDVARSRDRKLIWMRRGADNGDAHSQYELYRLLSRMQDPASVAEAEVWLRRAADGGYPNAQMALAEALATEFYRTQSPDLLEERNALLHKAAANGSRFAKMRLAGHYVDGSMGHRIEWQTARSLYVELAEGALTEYERKWQIAPDFYASRVAELEAWERGLEIDDPVVVKAIAVQVLRSQHPGPGVQSFGRQLMARLAEHDPAVRAELIVMLRTGSGGLEKDLPAAQTWLVNAAEAGDIDAMDRLAGNYMNGREGFAVDYPAARRWLAALATVYEGASDKQARMRLAQLQRDLKYIDRLDERAGGELIGADELESLSRQTDAESHYRYALQLLTGHGAKRRAEGVARMQAAADLDHAEAAWRLVHVYERGFADELDHAAAVRELERAARSHHFEATRELASRYEYGKKGLAQDLPKAIEMYEQALAAGRDNRYGWNLDPDNFNHFRWLESRLRQARMKLSAQASASQ
jgi:TPR repeat protein